MNHPTIPQPSSKRPKTQATANFSLRAKRAFRPPKKCGSRTLQIPQTTPTTPNFPQPGFCRLRRGPISLQPRTAIPDTHCAGNPAAESSGRMGEVWGGKETPSKGVSFPSQGLPLFSQISKFSANLAFCSMNWRRGSTLSPIRRENISSQAIASSIVTRRIVR